MYELSITTQFSAAHHLAGHKGGCAGQHGHNWEVTIFIRGPELDDIGVLVDFRDVKKAAATVLGELDHSDLNTIPAFSGRNPTSENIARHLFERLSATFNNPRYAVHRVLVKETPQAGVSYWAVD